MSNCAKCRKIGQKLCSSPKCTLEKRPTGPGQHGKRVGTKKLSEYGKQLSEKQKVKLMYGVLERQFRRLFTIASKQHGITGENLLSILERRLDNVVFRLKLAASRAQARQMIVHGHVTVNAGKVDKPSFLVKQGDIVAFAKTTITNSVFIENVVDKRLNTSVKVPEWLDLQKKDRSGVVLRLPIRSDITVDIAEHLIVELYSK